MRQLLCCLAFLTAGCATVGTNFDVASVQSIQPGTSEAQVIAMLGRPNVRTRLTDGSEMLVWSYGHAAAFGSATGKSAALEFDPAGRYIGVVSTSETRTAF